jgi:DNA primase
VLPEMQQGLALTREPPVGVSVSFTGQLQRCRSFLWGGNRRFHPFPFWWTAPLEGRMESIKEGFHEMTSLSEPSANLPEHNIEALHPYLAARGISPETIERFGVGYFPGKGSMAGRVVIPIHNERGELLAYAGRAIDDAEPKYKFPAGFHKGLVLYNLNRVLKKNSSGTVVIVEGFFDCMKVSQAGHACVALMGSSLSKRQEWLIRLFERVILMLDGDDEGHKATADISLRLSQSIWVKTLMLQDGQQPETLSGNELQKLIES